MPGMTEYPLFANFFVAFIDIAILTFLIYRLWLLIEKTNAGQIVRVAAAVVLGCALIVSLNLPTLSWVINKIAPVLSISLVIVFQPELRKIFLRIGSGLKFDFQKNARHKNFDAVINAAEELSALRRGMLAVFSRRDDLSDIISSGVTLNADVTSQILVTIFKFDTPLHDGAVVIQNGKIVAGGCFLPISSRNDLDKTFGTRHRAALGLSEEKDAVVLIVSEERGTLSVACEGNFIYDLSHDEVTRLLAEKLEGDKTARQSAPKEDSNEK